MEKQKMGGVVFPLVTPFCGEDEHVNYPALDKLIDFLIENGATGVIPCGSTGELVSMTLEEQLEINRHTIEYVNHRCKVYACTGAYRTSDAILLSKAAEKAISEFRKTESPAATPLTLLTATLNAPLGSGATPLTQDPENRA